MLVESTSLRSIPMGADVGISTTDPTATAARDGMRYAVASFVV